MVSNTVFLVVIASACVHASWNFCARKVKGHMGVFCIGLWTAAAIFAIPTVVVADIKSLQAEIWSMVASGVIHGAYIIALTQAYKLGDVSLVYPVARGTGVALTAVAETVLFDEFISAVGWSGVCLVVGGIVLLGLGKRESSPVVTSQQSDDCASLELVRSGAATASTDSEAAVSGEEDKVKIIDTQSSKTEERSLMTQADSETISVSIEDKVDVSSVPIAQAAKPAQFLKALLYSLLTGCIISSYSVIDSRAVDGVNPTVFCCIMVAVNAAAVTPFTLYVYPGHITEALHKYKLTSIVIGPVAIGTYLAVLYAFRGSKASYIVALREFAVVVGSALGFLFLKEKFTLQKAAGIGCILGGLAAIKLA